MEITDQELVDRYLNGDAKAFDTIVSRHLKSVYNFAYRQTGSEDESNDIAQEVFVRIWKHLKRYDPKQNFKTWIFAIARNASIDWLRKRKPLHFSELNNSYTEETFEESLRGDEPLPDEVYERGEVKGIVEKLLQGLTIDQRTAVILRTTEHLAFEDIAMLMNKPLNTVKSHYRRALISMRKKLIEDSNHAPN